ncbi:MAG: CRISPR-associated endonuclease Cas2 [Chitinivibrionales bacterium]|nr:CRISPR-associated endonuclease Cas2 [Chitinivibrionales bacterium]
MKYVIAFDIVNDRTRASVVKILLEYGYRVQKSVFEGFLSKESVDECAEKIRKIIDKRNDSVRFYPLCKDCERELFIIGIGKKVEEVDYLII